MPGYSHITYAQLQTEVAARLDDSGNVYWSVSEVQSYILEALRTWQAFAHYWRERMSFLTTANQIFYDLTAQPNSLISYTQKDTDLISIMLSHLTEPQLNAGVYVGTDMFVLPDFIKALERRRNQFLFETGLVTTRTVMNWLAPPISRAPIDDRIIDVRRAAWIDTANAVTVLFRSNEWVASAVARGWEIAPSLTPLEYSIATEPPVSLQVIPPPQNNGQVELLSILTGATLTGAGVLLGIPDDFAWAIKWGALADLLAKAGQSHDMLRSQYCEKRYQEGVVLGRLHTSAVQGLLNGRQTFINALQSFDTFNPNWENAAPTAPADLALASWNMLVVSPPPDSNSGTNYSISLDCVRNAPVPVLAGDFIQMGREELDVLIDYIEHLAMFKLGGDEFMATIPLYGNFQRLAAVYNQKLKAGIDFVEPLGDRAQREEVLHPRVAQQ
jgi:hypothetical protein